MTRIKNFDNTIIKDVSQHIYYWQKYFKNYLAFSSKANQ